MTHNQTETPVTAAEAVTDGNRRLADLMQERKDDFNWVISRDIADALARDLGLDVASDITQWLGLPVVVLSGGFANVQRYINLDNDPRNMPKP